MGKEPTWFFSLTTLLLSSPLPSCLEPSYESSPWSRTSLAILLTSTGNKQFVDLAFWIRRLLGHKEKEKATQSDAESKAYFTLMNMSVERVSLACMAGRDRWSLLKTWCIVGESKRKPLAWPRHACKVKETAVGLFGMGQSACLNLLGLFGSAQGAGHGWAVRTAAWVC